MELFSFLFPYKMIKLIELRPKKKKEGVILWLLFYGRCCQRWHPAFSRLRHACPLTFLWTAVPGFHTGKALCHTALSNVTSNSSLLALKTWIPSGFLAPQTVEALCVSLRYEDTEATAFTARNAFSTTYVPLSRCFSTLFGERKLQNIWGIWDLQVMVHRGNWATFRSFPGLRETYGGRVFSCKIRILDCIIEVKGQSI